MASSCSWAAALRHSFLHFFLFCGFVSAEQAPLLLATCSQGRALLGGWASARCCCWHCCPGVARQALAAFIGLLGAARAHQALIVGAGFLGCDLRWISLSWQAAQHHGCTQQLVTWVVDRCQQQEEPPFPWRGVAEACAGIVLSFRVACVLTLGASCAEAA